MLWTWSVAGSLESMFKRQGPSLSALVRPCQTEGPGQGRDSDGTLLTHERKRTSLIYIHVILKVA